MKINVELLAQARHASGSEGQELSVPPGSQLSVALAAIAARLDPAFREGLFSDAGTVRPSVMVLVNGNVVSRGREQALADGDTITLMTPIGGG